MWRPALGSSLASPTATRESPPASDTRSPASRLPLLILACGYACRGPPLASRPAAAMPRNRAAATPLAASKLGLNVPALAGAQLCKSFPTSSGIFAFVGLAPDRHSSGCLAWRSRSQTPLCQRSTPPTRRRTWRSAPVSICPALCARPRAAQILLIDCSSSPALRLPSDRLGLEAQLVPNARCQHI